MTSLPNKLFYAWSGHAVTSIPLDPDITLTLGLKENYLLDVRRAKNDLIVCQDFPDFPDALWLNVLLN